AAIFTDGNSKSAEAIAQYKEKLLKEVHEKQGYEYLVIKTLPRSIDLYLEYVTNSFQEAQKKCDLENLAHDYSSFAVRVMYKGKLYRPDDYGYPSVISKQQDWSVHQKYLDAHYSQHQDCEIFVCNCSYPYFKSLIGYIDNENEWCEYLQPITCLISDSGRKIELCPNCNCRIPEYEDEEDEEDEEEEEDDIPYGCQDCQYYYGTEIVCAVHPYGKDNCPDFLEMGLASPG
ncbi:MAG: hypothetical protein AAF378_23940, partial [Cyanobacteria bacterium P01_A01_bin.84]